MIVQEGTRAVLHCDLCEHRIDLMPWARHEAFRNADIPVRLPWPELAGRHSCPSHALRHELVLSAR